MKIYQFLCVVYVVVASFLAYSMEPVINNPEVFNQVNHAVNLQFAHRRFYGLWHPEVDRFILSKRHIISVSHATLVNHFVYYNNNWTRQEVDSKIKKFLQEADPSFQVFSRLITFYKI